MDKEENNNLNNPEKDLLHNIDENQMVTKSNTPLLVGVILGAIIFGILSGFGINAVTSNKSGGYSTQAENNKDKSPDAKQTAGILDKTIFKDTAEGILKEGGFEGEGSFHLERPGGKDQTAYLTSQTVDLNLYIGKKVRIWGQTFEAKKAGWLMDVGYLEVI